MSSLVEATFKKGSIEYSITLRNNLPWVSVNELRDELNRLLDFINAKEYVVDEQIDT